MTGGISAISGFDYQATVALDLLLSHFAQYRDTAKVRPEGIDDLDLMWEEGGRRRQRFVQIKKPRQNRRGELRHEPWTTADALTELFPHALRVLQGNDDRQDWILGDTVADDLATLVEQGPAHSMAAYLRLVHAQAWKRTEARGGLDEVLKRKLRRWKFDGDLSVPMAQVADHAIESLVQYATSQGLSRQHAEGYRSAFVDLSAELPGILQRISIVSTNGTEPEVAARVKKKLEQQYQLSAVTVEFTLFRNLRGYINDIAKQPDQTFDARDFEFELKSVWPTMNPIKELLPPVGHVARQSLVRTILAASGNAVEVTGISGSGKTSLAYEIKEQLAFTEPDRTVFYSEVRDTDSLRDTLVGMAFHLRRMGMAEPFAVATDPRHSNESALGAMARVLATPSLRCTLLLDLVDGVADLTFYRDLAAFVRALPRAGFNVIVFAHVKALQGLSELERSRQNVITVPMDGLDSSLFARLVKLHQTVEPLPAAIWDVFQHVTTNRSTGIEAALAYALARAESMDVMLQLATQPPDTMLRDAERSRFARISDGCRRAGELLTCFVLPFRIDNAELIFAEENVRQAVHELLQLGLLRADTDGFLEMHETVRAGLEASIALATRRQAHEALALWYGSQRRIGPQVLHLEKAGRAEDARAVARAAFLQGSAWDQLSGYVTEHRLVSARELVDLACGDTDLPNVYLLGRLFQGVAEPGMASILLQAIRTHWERFAGNYQWAIAMTEALVGAEPTILHDLIELAVSLSPVAWEGASALDYLSQGVRRVPLTIEARTVQLYRAQPAENQLRLLPLLLLDRRRDTFATVFESLVHIELALSHSGANKTPPGLHLRLNDSAEAIEFFAALPALVPEHIQLGQALLPAALRSLIWAEHHDFRAHAYAVLDEPSAENGAIAGAMRVLLFLGAPGLSERCIKFSDRPAPLGALVSLLPVIADDGLPTARLEATIRDRSMTDAACIHAVIVLAMRGQLTGSVFEMLRSREVSETDIEILKGALFQQLPKDIALVYLERHMASYEGAAAPLLAVRLAALGQLPEPRATAMLIQALSHSDEGVRLVAAVQLGRIRSTEARAHLTSRYAQEPSRSVAVELASSSVGCHPSQLDDLIEDAAQSTTTLWRCIAIGRLRDARGAPLLVKVATDPQQPWRTRRAAILAAGRLPFALALHAIAPEILRAPAVLPADRHVDYLEHALLVDFLNMHHVRLAREWSRGAEAFQHACRSSLEALLRMQMVHNALSVDETVTWLWGYVSTSGVPAHEALQRLMEALHLPMLQAAALRSLRYSDQPAVLEMALDQATSPWLAMRALIERLRMGGLREEDHVRIGMILDHSPWSEFPRLKNVWTEHTPSLTSMPPSAPADASSTLPPTVVMPSSLLACLRGDDGLLTLSPPFVLDAAILPEAAPFVALLSPSEDPGRARRVGEPTLTLGPEGYRLGATFTSQPNPTDTLRSWLRAAFAARVLGGIDIPWHTELMASRWGGLEYRRHCVVSLAALNDGDRFYSVLSQDDGFLMTLLTEASVLPQVAHVIDERICPWLLRYARAGTDKVLVSLCALAGFVATPAVDPVLNHLLVRWARSLPSSIMATPERAAALWHAFQALSRHPRFVRIPGWCDCLIPLLELPLPPFHRQMLLGVLQQNPRAYVAIEKEGMKALNFIHHYVDDVDRYDVVADRLFQSVPVDDNGIVQQVNS